MPMNIKRRKLFAVSLLMLVGFVCPEPCFSQFGDRPWFDNIPAEGVYIVVHTADGTLFIHQWSLMHVKET